VPGNGNKVLRRVEIKKNVLVTGEAGWCLPGCFKVLRFFRGSVGKELIHQLKRMKDLNTVLLVHIPADRDPASWAPCNNNGGVCLPDVP
jgi:hypothetical protein